MKPTTSLLGKLGDGWISSRREIPHCQIASSISPWKSVHPWFKWDWIYTFLCPSLKHWHQKPTPPWLLAHCQILAELFTQVQLFPLKVCSVELCLINDSLCSLCGTAWAYYLTHSVPHASISVCKMHILLQVIFLAKQRIRLRLQSMGRAGSCANNRLLW